MSGSMHKNPEHRAAQRAWLRERAKSAWKPVLATSLFAGGMAVFQWFLSSERALSTLAVMLVLTLVILPAVALPAVIFANTSKRPPR